MFPLLDKTNSVLLLITVTHQLMTLFHYEQPVISQFEHKLGICTVHVYTMLKINMRAVFNISLHGRSPVSYTHLDVYKRQLHRPVFLSRQ